MEYIEITSKTLDDAITEACERLCITSDRLDYEVVQESSNGFLGINAKPAIIKARIKENSNSSLVEDDKPFYNSFLDEKVSLKDVEKKVNKTSKREFSKHRDEDKPFTGDSEVLISKSREFLENVFTAMQMKVDIKTEFNADDSVLDINLKGDDMGVLIGKRGQTLDSLQYLVSLVVNKDNDCYIHVKVDTENYRQRRKDTLENLARNISFKVKKTRQPVALEPMNPYERRIIHSALQGDRYVTTHSEGEEPFRRVVITLKK